MGAYAECTKGCVDSHGYTLSVLSDVLIAVYVR